MKQLGEKSMFKLICRTLFIAILSGSLLINGAPEARAETVSTKGVGDENMLATLTMSAVGIIASRMWKCKMTTDMMLAAAGGAAFLVGDVLAYSDLKKVMKDLQTEVKRDESGKADRAQISALERLKESYEKAKKAAGTKKTLQQLAAAAFAAAAIAAYMLVAEEQAIIAACQAGITTAVSTCSAMTGPACPTCAAGAAQLSAQIATPQLIQGISLIPAPSNAQGVKTTSALGILDAALTAASGTCPAAAAAVGACQPIKPLFALSKGVCPMPLVVDNNLFTPIHPTPNLFEQIFFSPVYAGDMFSPMGIVSSLAIGYIIGTATNLGLMIDVIMFSPMNRAIVWGIFSALTLAASSATDDVIKKLEENIAKIDGILKEMNKLTNGNAGTNVAAAEKDKEKKSSEKPVLVDVQANGDVLFSSSEAQQNLPCVAGPDSAKCDSFMEKLKKSPDFINFSPEMKDMVMQIARGVGHINGASSVTAGNIGAINTALKDAGSVQNMLAKKQKEVQTLLKKNGSKFNFAQESEKFSKSLRAMMEKGLKEKKMSAREMSALMGTGALSAKIASKDETLKTISKDVAKKASAPTHVGALAGNHLPSPAATSVPGVTMKDGLETAPENANAGDANDKYEINNLDIVTDKNESIFVLLSNRYLKSAFPRLLDKTKAQDKK